MKKDLKNVAGTCDWEFAIQRHDSGLSNFQDFYI